MPIVPFEYHAPATLEAAVDLLRKYGGEAKPLAGGQSLVPMLALRLARPRVVVDLNQLEALKAVRRDDGSVVIGALVRHQALERGEGAMAACPVLQEAAALIGNGRVRALGTIGGSLAHADPAAELPAAVRALDGTVLARGPRGERAIPARDFFTGILSTALAPDELLVEVRLPALGPAAGYAVEELSRRAGDFAIIAVVAVVDLGASGKIQRARLALAGAGPTPRRLERLEAALPGVPSDAAALRDAVWGTELDLEPESDVHASAAYRRHLARVLTARALARAAARAGRRGRG